jgi:hypothetical protein
LIQKRAGGQSDNPAKPNPADWRSRPESNRDTRIRNPLLYPFELREQTNKNNAFMIFFKIRLAI